MFVELCQLQDGRDFKLNVIIGGVSAYVHTRTDIITVPSTRGLKEKKAVFPVPGPAHRRHPLMYTLSCVAV